MEDMDYFLPDTDNQAAESSLAPSYQVHLLAINLTNLLIFILYTFPITGVVSL